MEALGKDLAAPQGFEPRYADPESAVLAVERGGSGGVGRCQRRDFILWLERNDGQQRSLIER